MGRPIYNAIICPNDRPHGTKNGGFKKACGHVLRYFINPLAQYDDVCYCPKCSVLWKIIRNETGGTTLVELPKGHNLSYRIEPVEALYLTPPGKRGKKWQNTKS